MSKANQITELNTNDFIGLCKEGLENRMKSINTNKNSLYNDRLDHEVNIILANSYERHLMQAMELINKAGKAGFNINIGRGNICCSLAAFALGVTNIDPIKNSLIFEDFLYADMDQLPDIYLSSIVTSQNSFPPTLEEGFKKNNMHISFLPSYHLSVIQETANIIKRDFGREIDFTFIDYNDPAVFNAINLRNNSDLFIDGDKGLQKLIKSFTPRKLTSLADIISLQRISKENFTEQGFANQNSTQLDCRSNVIYQEQFILALQKTANLSLHEAHTVRREFAKKNFNFIERFEYKLSYIEAFVNNENFVEDVIVFIERFCTLFTKSHCTAEAYTIYNAAFLKTYFPKEFRQAVWIINNLKRMPDSR